MYEMRSENPGARLDALASRMKHGTAFFFLVFHKVVVLSAAWLGRFVILCLFFCHSLLSYSGDLMLNGADRTGSDYTCICITVTKTIFSNSEKPNTSTVPKYPVMDMSWTRYGPLKTL